LLGEYPRAMRKAKPIVIIILFFMAFQAKCQNRKYIVDSIPFYIHDTAFSKHTQTFAITRRVFEQLYLNYCDTFFLVFDGFYPIKKVLDIAMNDTIFVGRFLESKGFVRSDYGWGNWDKGPRFANAKYTKDSCKCEVYRVYYYYEKMKDGYFNLKIKEAIICNQKSPDWMGNW
jgi:hypothetical protein